MKISGNTVFIPGATSGIGLALALALRDKGNEVIIGGRRQGLLDRISTGMNAAISRMGPSTCRPSYNASKAAIHIAHRDAAP